MGIVQKSPETLAELVTDIVSHRSMTGYEIARALESRHRVDVRGAEGGVYVALLQLTRDGWLEGVKEADGRVRYRLPVLTSESTSPRSKETR